MVVSALKEWAVVCKGLEEGRQTILLRKGGIMERKHGFELKHNDFFIFPTYEHQSKEFLQQDYVNKLDPVLDRNPSKRLNNIISLYAKVIVVKETFDSDLVHKLRDFHIWNERYINTRMDYNPGKPISIILLRIHKLCKDIQVNLSPEQAGCRSWIDIHSLNMEYLQENIGKPILDNDTFEKTYSDLMEVLNS
jgi:hypothetical protein